MDKSADLEKPLEMEISIAKIEVEEMVAGDKRMASQNQRQNQKRKRRHMWHLCIIWING